MKILHISHNDGIGGAGKACSRLNQAIKNAGLKSEILVRNKVSTDMDVFQPGGRMSKVTNPIRTIIGNALSNIFKKNDINYKSGNWLPSDWSNLINKNDAEIINLHWIAGETINFKDLKKIKKKIVWTLHDMWAFTGLSHLDEIENCPEWQNGYAKLSAVSKIFNPDYCVWRRKMIASKNIDHVVAPSQWMGSLAKKSHSFKNKIIHVVPNPINLKIYKKFDKIFCRKFLNLSDDIFIILCGAANIADQNKGFDLLQASLHELFKNNPHYPIQVITFGHGFEAVKLPYPIINCGYISDDYRMSMLYNAADLMVVPSRMENLPQTATEAISCGCPVVGFKTSGLLDAVKHLETGYLAQPFDILDLAHGIELQYRDKELREKLSGQGVDFAHKNWSFPVVAEKYIQIYREIGYD